jgi:hypothetical protein
MGTMTACVTVAAASLKGKRRYESSLSLILWGWVLTNTARCVKANMTLSHIVSNKMTMKGWHEIIASCVTTTC